jgi:hypothetical protein
MSNFSPSDAAFEGFRLTRERPKVVLVWAVVSFLVTLVTLPLLISSGLGKAMMLAEQGSDPSATMGALLQGGPAYVALLVGGLIVQSVFVAAVYRAVLRPEDNRFAYLRLGMDELRQVALFFVLLAILMLAVFLIVLIGGVVSAMATGLLNAAGGGQGLVYLVTMAISLWVMGLVIFVIVRLSLALPMTFAQRRVRVFAAWRLTHGAFWRLTGAYLLAMVMFIVVWLLALIIFSALAAAVGAMQGLDLAAAMGRFNADTSSLQAYFTLPTLIYALFSALISAIYYAVMVAPSAVAYQTLIAERGEEAHALQPNS